MKNGKVTKIKNKKNEIHEPKEKVPENSRENGYVGTQTFKDNFGMPLILVGMYGKPLPGKIVATALVVWNVFHLNFLIYTLYHSVVLDFDLGLFSATLFYVLMDASIVFTIINFQYYKKNLESIYFHVARSGDWQHCFNYLSGSYNFFKRSSQLETNFYNYKDSLDPETQEEVNKEKNKMLVRKKYVSTYLAWMFIITGIGNMVIVPIILGPSEQKDDYIHRNLPVKCYYPISTVNLSWEAWIWMLFIEYIITYTILLGAMGTDVPFVCFAEEGLFQMTALAITLRHIIRRAKYLYEKRKNETQLAQFSDCLKECLGHSVRHHYEIIKYFDNLQTIYYFLLLVIMLGGTFLLCTSGVLFVSDSVELKEKLQFCLFLITIMFHIFMFSLYGELLAGKSQLLGEEVYNSEWQKYKTLMKTYVLIIQAYSQKPIQFSAGGFMTSNLNNFGNVLSSAYSYFNLLTIMMSRES